MTPDVNDAPSATFSKALIAAAKMPGVRIDREAFIRRSLSSSCPPEQVDAAVAGSPQTAGVPPETIARLTRAAITFETRNVTLISGASGIPGGFALIGTIPVDAAQYLAHLLRVSQKLAYLHGWPSLTEAGSEQLDDETQNLLTLFIGAMFGVQAANKGIALVAERLAAQALVRLPKQALTKGVVYPIVKVVARALGVQMTKSVFARGFAKAIPVVGGVLSGGVTFATFRPMARRLDAHLATLRVAPVTGADASIASTDAREIVGRGPSAAGPSESGQ